MEYTIILADGTQLQNLTLNGNCFISTVPFSEELLSDDNLLTVQINGTTYHNMTCMNYWIQNDETWFILHERTQEELNMIALNAKIDFLMALQGVI